MPNDIKDGYASRLLFQMETAFAAPSTERILEFITKTRATFEPVLTGGGRKLDIYRNPATSTHSKLHYRGTIEAEYRHDTLLALLLGMLFELRDQTTDTGTGLTTYEFVPRRVRSMATCKIGLEYNDGPYYVFHGVALQTVRLSVSARTIARIFFDFVAADREEIPYSRTYTMPCVLIYGEYSFETETVIGPCYEDPSGQSALSCDVDDIRRRYLATQAGEILKTEDGFKIILDGGLAESALVVGTQFVTTINGEVLATLSDLSITASDPKRPARHNQNQKPTAIVFAGGFQYSGEMTVNFDGTTLPNLAVSYAEAELKTTLTFDTAGRKLEMTHPRVKLAAASPPGASKGDLIYKASWEGLETEATGAGDSVIVLVL